MPWIAGIDEVGYGPRLGPLVVSAALFEIPDDDTDLWKALSPAVAAAPSKSCAAAVCDSKLLHQPGDLTPLERTAVAFWRARDGAHEQTFVEFVAAHCSEALDQLAEVPWYREPALPLPFVHDSADLALRAAAVRAALGAAGVRFAGLRSTLADALAFNAGIERTGNKSDFLFESSAPLYRWLWDTVAGPRPLTVHVGKQGGRTFYSDRLQALFPEAFVMTSAESAELSVYAVESKSRRMRFTFSTDAESRHFPVALASILAKYTREGLMAVFNRWWAERLPGLRPTAGYHEDAGRFLKETEAVRRELAIDDRCLVRTR